MYLLFADACIYCAGPLRVDRGTGSPSRSFIYLRGIYLGKTGITSARCLEPGVLHYYLNLVTPELLEYIVRIVGNKISVLKDISCMYDMHYVILVPLSTQSPVHGGVPSGTV